MVTNLITLKLERNFLEEIDLIVKNQNYQNRTEFIRTALRDKVEKARTREIMEEILSLKGLSSKKTSDKDLERLRKKAFEELEKEFK